MPDRSLTGAESRPVTVLCVDDDRDSRKLLDAILGHEGRYVVLLADSGRSGLSAARRSAPDMILLDLDLPDLHGTRVAAELRADERTSGIPLVGVSATSNPHPGWVKRSGLDGFVRKPIEDIPAFLETLERVLQPNRGQPEAP